MRRLLFITAFALSLTVPLCAQHGGRGGSGGHGGFSGSHGGSFAGHGFSGGHMSGGHFSGGMRRGFSHGPARVSGRGFSQGNRFRGGFRGGDRFHHRSRFRDRGFRRNCFGFGCGRETPLWGAYYDPWFWDWSNTDAEFDADYYNNRALANEMNEQSLEQQRLLRQEEADGDQDAYARSSAPRGSSNSTDVGSGPAVPTLSTILVFRDQRQEEIQNYAIVGETLWNLSPQRRKKIALADLDLPATQKVNDDRGVTFRVPAVNEGQ